MIDERPGDSTLIGDGLVMASMAETINRERPGTGFGEERSQ
ncbi:MAG: hypothetical protein OXU81_11975 [Gammaproteobacteria bacterium]|nr:hypothetical protein [Gammaproteobacteria bacterium]